MAMPPQNRLQRTVAKPVQHQFPNIARQARLNGLSGGLTLRDIVERLALEGVPTVSGGGWHISTVQRVLARSLQLLEPGAVGSAE
jgi:hypothetical protein